MPIKYSVAEAVDRVTTIYGPRNALRGITLEGALHQMRDISITVIGNLARNQVAPSEFHQPLASLLAWWGVALGMFPRLNLGFYTASALHKKHLGITCLRCDKSVCRCDDTDRRSYFEVAPGETTLVQIDSTADPLASLSISDTQRVLRKKYGLANAGRSIEEVIQRLAQEVAECSDCLREHAFRKWTQSQQIAELGAELADVFAWICALANTLKIDLAQVFQESYQAGCPFCRQQACICEAVDPGLLVGSKPTE